MKHIRPLTLASLLTLALGLASMRAQPSTSVEHINAVTTASSPGEMFFPNVYDPFHPKELHFEGIATGGGDPTTFPGTLWVQFDWQDPVLGVQYSPAWAYAINYTPDLTPIDVFFTIPFCPQEVSIHFGTDVPFGGVVNIAGDFTHTCIPEPGPTALVGALGILGFATWRRQANRPRLGSRN